MKSSVQFWNFLTLAWTSVKANEDQRVQNIEWRGNLPNVATCKKHIVSPVMWPVSQFSVLIDWINKRNLACIYFLFFGWWVSKELQGRTCLVDTVVEYAPDHGCGWIFNNKTRDAFGFISVQKAGFLSALTAKGCLFHIEANVMWQMFTGDVTFLTV